MIENTVWLYLTLLGERASEDLFGMPHSSSIVEDVGLYPWPSPKKLLLCPDKTELFFRQSEDSAAEAPPSVLCVQYPRRVLALCPMCASLPPLFAHGPGPGQLRPAAESGLVSSRQRTNTVSEECRKGKGPIVTVDS